MHVQLWSPDTCGCVIHQRVDDDGTVTNITYEEAEWIVSTLRLARGADGITRDPQPPGRICPIHASHLNPHDVVLRENRGKNQALDEAQKLKPGLTAEHYRWSFDADRVLQVEFEGVTLSAAEKGQLQAALHARLGQGKARVH